MSKNRFWTICGIFAFLALWHLLPDFLIPSFGLARASLHDVLTPPGVTGVAQSGWVFDIWKISLGMANGVVVIVLLFFAAVNILHIQYDTYQIKRSFPPLVLGIVMANFSLIICRMIVDVALVITSTFYNMPQLTNDLLCTFTLPPMYGIGLLLLIVLWIALLIAVLIITFLLWIRIVAIYALTAVSPLAFVLMAFPPTQSVFKQWWTWFIRWVFMGPIVIFLIWVATKVGADNCHAINIPTLLFSVGIVSTAAIVPFKLGGDIMSKWSNLGKKSASLAGKAAYDNPWAKAQRAKTGANLARWWDNTRLGRSINRARSREESFNKTREEERKGAIAREGAALSAGERGQHMLRRRQAQRGYEQQEAQETSMTDAIEAGQRLEGLTETDYRRITGNADAMEVAQEYMNITNQIKIAKSSLEKRRDIDINLASLEDLRDYYAVAQSMEDNVMADGIDINLYDSHGNDSTVAGIRTGVNGRDRVTYADLINRAARARADSKSASDPAEKARHRTIAEEYENQVNAYRQANTNRYDFDRVLDYNTIGRRYKEIAPRIMEEADVTKKSSTGRSVVTALDKEHGTSEYRNDRDGANRALVGRWDQNTVTGNFATAQQIIAIDAFIAQGVRSGDYEGLQSLDGLVNRIQQAHNEMQTGQEYKSDLISDAISDMDDPDMQTEMLNILAQRGGYTDWTAVQNANAVSTVINNVDLSQLQVLGPDRENRIQRQFAERLYAGIHADENLNFGANPAANPTRGARDIPSLVPGGPTIQRRVRNARPRG